MKHAIVTGGAGLIGRAICARLLAEGWQVASLDIRQPDGPCAAGLTRITCDIGDEAAVTAAFAGLDWPRIDLVVNNGGLVGGTPAPLAETSLDDWQATLGSHLTGAFLVSRAAAPRLAAGSAIVMIASTRALMSEGWDFAYAAAKGGMVALAQALAVQLGPRTRVNTIAPGWISGETGLSAADHAQHPVGRVGRPEDIAEAVSYLAQAGFVTGQLLPVDGGMTRKMIYHEE